MGCLITFSDRSAREIYSALAPEANPHAYLSSRLLNRQIKYAMHKLHREATLLVFEDLERSFHSRTKTSWGPSFCSILLLCFCIEGLQTIADVIAVCAMAEEGDALFYDRDQSYKACTDLDDYPFQQCKKLFHAIYRTNKRDDTQGHAEAVFNPLRMAADAARMGLDACTEGMVRAIYGIVVNNCESSPSCLGILKIWYLT
jgi:hypothetical protein